MPGQMPVVFQGMLCMVLQQLKKEAVVHVTDLRQGGDDGVFSRLLCVRVSLICILGMRGASPKTQQAVENTIADAATWLSLPCCSVGLGGRLRVCVCVLVYSTCNRDDDLEQLPLPITRSERRCQLPRHPCRKPGLLPFPSRPSRHAFATADSTHRNTLPSCDSHPRHPIQNHARTAVHDTSAASVLPTNVRHPRRRLGTPLLSRYIPVQALLLLNGSGCVPGGFVSGCGAQVGARLPCRWANRPGCHGGVSCSCLLGCRGALGGCVMQRQQGKQQPAAQY